MLGHILLYIYSPNPVSRLGSLAHTDNRGLGITLRDYGSSKSSLSMCKVVEEILPWLLVAGGDVCEAMYELNRPSMRTFGGIRGSNFLSC